MITKLAQIKKKHPKRLDFYRVNFEVKIRQNVGQICETIKKQRHVSPCYYGGGLLKGCFHQGQYKFYNFDTMSKEIFLK